MRWGGGVELVGPLGSACPGPQRSRPRSSSLSQVFAAPPQTQSRLGRRGPRRIVQQLARRSTAFDQQDASVIQHHALQCILVLIDQTPHKETQRHEACACVELGSCASTSHDTCRYRRQPTIVPRSISPPRDEVDRKRFGHACNDCSTAWLGDHPSQQPRRSPCPASGAQRLPLGLILEPETIDDVRQVPTRGSEPCWSTEVLRGPARSQDRWSPTTIS